MTRLKETQVLFGAQPMYLHVKFDSSAETTTSGKNGDANGWIPAGGLFMVTPLTPDLSFGFSVAGNFGLGLDYGDDWVGRYYLKEVLLQGVVLAPALAYRINELDRIKDGSAQEFQSLLKEGLGELPVWLGSFKR